jgi:hypothetical protein
MDFRDGDSAAEARSASVRRREEARAHPLDAPRETCAGAEKIVAEKAFADPLGALSSQARDGDDDARARDSEASDAESAESDEDAPTETTARRRQDDDEDREACAEWEAEKRRFAARARRAADSGVIHSRRAAAGAVQTRLEALCDPGALAVAETGRSRRKDVVATVDALRGEIKTAWREKNRLDALLLTVRAASLLDVEYPASAAAAADACAFYPALFGLVCDVLDDAGAAIYERIKAKSEFDDETGARRATLRRDFDARDVPEDAKATCLNWFRKIENIPDVVPRVYMRIATLRCSRFVEDREALRARFATIADVELKRVEDPLVGAFARAYAAKAGATLTALRSRSRERRGIERSVDGGLDGGGFLEETLRSLVTDFADVVDLFEYPEYAAWKRRDRAAREAERARENEDLIDAIENFFVDAFNDEWYAFEDHAEARGVQTTAGPGGADEADPASGALAAMRDEKRKESVAEAMAWSARCFARRAPRSALAESAADFLATASSHRADGTAETRPMKRALNVAFARACLEAMSAEDAAAAAGTFVNLLTRAASPGANDGRRDDGDRSVDPTVLECVRLLGARLSETPPPELETRGALLAEAWSIAATAAGGNPAQTLSSFLRCAETWTDFAAAHVRDEDGEDGRVVSSVLDPLLRDVAAKVTSFLERTSPSGGGAAPPTLAEDDQAAVERVLTRALRRERDRGERDSALFESGAFGALVATLHGAARASFFRNALRAFLYDDARGESFRATRGSDDARPTFPEARFLENKAARAFARRAAAAAHESLGARDDVPNSVPNETDRLLVRYVRANVCFLKSRSAFHEALRFLASARVAFADSDAAQRETALSAAWLGASVSVHSESFAAATAAFCRVTALGVRNGEARVRLYLSAACAASVRGDEAADARRRSSALVRDAVADLANKKNDSKNGSASDASAAETVARCAAALATLVDTRDDVSEASEASEASSRTGRTSSRRSLGVLARFVLERRWKQGSADRVAANLAVARAAAALARREAVTNAKAFSRRRVALLETAHACLQTAVDVSETVDATRAASDARAAAFLDVAECVSSSFAATAAMRDLASELARRAREDAVDARDGRVAAVEKTVARFCAAASEAGQTLGV